MVDQNLTLFNEIYDQTYDKVLRYVISKCGNTNDIADIVQETYLELYQTIVKRGAAYIKNPGAFVLQLAKAKVYKHYSLMEKLKRILPRSPWQRRCAPAPEEVQVHEAFVNSATVGKSGPCSGPGPASPEDLLPLLLLRPQIAGNQQGARPP